jgi:hypothetical protein
MQQLARDLGKNPKKAALLALLAGVALWFWAPLIIGWFRGEEPDVAADQAATNSVLSAVSASPVATSPVSTAPGAAKGAEANVAEAPTQTWQQLVHWMEQDPRRKAEDIRLERDPFAPPKPAAKPAAQQAKSAARAPANPQKVNLKLTGTLVGTEQRVALINGRAYTEGQQVKVSPEVVFVVRQVEAKKVTLERDGQRLVLETPKRVGQEK